MTPWVKVRLRVKPDEESAFNSWVESQHGQIERFRGIEIRRAMREFCDSDELADLEAEIDEVIRSAGRRPADCSEKKSAGVSFDYEGTGTAINTRVPKSLRESFVSFAKRNDLRPGEALTRAMYERRNGGRVGRIMDKFERTRDVIEANHQEDTGEGDGLSTTEKRKQKILRDLNEQFTDDDLVELIKEHAGGSDPTIRQYREYVFEERDVEPHPNVPELYVPPEVAAEYADGDTEPDAPAFERHGWDSLDREQRVHALRVVVAREAAARRNGKRAMPTADLNAEAFDGEGVLSTISELVDVAGTAEGFTVDQKRGVKRLLVDWSKVTDTDVIEDAERSDATGPGSVYNPSPSASSDTTADTAAATDGGESVDDVESQFDRLDSATPTG